MNKRELATPILIIVLLLGLVFTFFKHNLMMQIISLLTIIALGYYIFKLIKGD